MEFIKIFEYTFMRNALIVGLLSSICCGIIGTYIVNKKMVFISSSISHASYGGIGIGIYLIYFFNLPIKDPLFFGLIFSILSGVLILVLKDTLHVDGDLGIGIVMSMGMAIGIIFSFLTPGYQSDMSTYLFGNILLSNTLNIILLLILDIITITFFIIFYKSIIYTSFDENFYKIHSVPVTLHKLLYDNPNILRHNNKHKNNRNHPNNLNPDNPAGNCSLTRKKILNNHNSIHNFLIHRNTIRIIFFLYAEYSVRYFDYCIAYDFIGGG